MKARIAAIIGMAVTATLMLSGCTEVQPSSPGVRVVGDNVAQLPQGGTMVLHYSDDDSEFSWLITYAGGSKVHFYRDDPFGDDNADINVDSRGVETKYDPGWLELDMWVSRRDDRSVNIRWEDGLVFQPPKS